MLVSGEDSVHNVFPLPYCEMAGVPCFGRDYAASRWQLLSSPPSLSQQDIGPSARRQLAFYARIIPAATELMLPRIC